MICSQTGWRSAWMFIDGAVFGQGECWHVVQLRRGAGPYFPNLADSGAHALEPDHIVFFLGLSGGPAHSACPARPARLDGTAYTLRALYTL